MRKPKILVTCEHASKRVPAAYASKLQLPNGKQDQHRIYDWGAQAVAQGFAEASGAPYWEGKVTRLLIDLNRSISNPELFQGGAQRLSETDKAELIAEYYLPFRKEVESKARKWIEKGFRVLHLSIHSFTPVLNNQKRLAELGILFDESRPLEASIAEGIMKYHKDRYDCLAVLPNSPYWGTDDGHTTALRKVFPENYAGIEIEYSQILDLERQSARWVEDLVESIEHAIAGAQTA